MIVVCGTLEAPGPADPAAIEIARRAVAAGAAVQVVGIVADGPSGDRRLGRLATAGIGHAAVLRAGRPLEPADVELALRYLPDVRVVVGVDLEGPVADVLADGAAFDGAACVLVGREGGAADGAPAADATGASEAAANPASRDTTIVIGAPASDPDGSFAGFVAAYAARLDAGEGPSGAWDATPRALAVDPVSPG